MAELNAAPRNQSDCANLEVNVFLYSKELDWTVDLDTLYLFQLVTSTHSWGTDRSKDWTEGGQ